MDLFWKLFEERAELCHKAHKERIKYISKTKASEAPIMWMYGALARLDADETIDKLFYNGYATCSLGYAGLYECVKYMTGHSHMESGGKEFGIKVMQALNDKCEQWKQEENVGYSVYGSPIENCTYKFAKSLQKSFGIIEGITDRDYVTNSSHVPVFEEIDIFSKIKIESEFQRLSLGGAISYIETPNMTKNIPALLEVIKHIYNTIMYAEINTMTSYCHVCGCRNIHMGDDLKFHCPQCGNDDFDKMNIAVRICGYVSTNPFNEGRAQDIHDRVYHIDSQEIDYGKNSKD